jgi:AraC-like DNA-binding protein
MHRRLERAKTLIRRTNQPLAEIAQQVGLCDQSHLTSMFRPMTGVTPGRYRAALAGAGQWRYGMLAGTIPLIAAACSVPSQLERRNIELDLQRFVAATNDAIACRQQPRRIRDIEYSMSACH